MKQSFLLVVLLCLLSSSTVWAQKVEKAEIPQNPTQTVPQPVEQVYVIVEQMPEFPGEPDAMNAFLSNNIKYPQQALIDSVQGTVYVSFIINRTGALEYIQVVKGLRKDLDEEAVRVIGLMPPWKPGKQRGKPVLVKYVLPIRFRLE